MNEGEIERVTSRSAIEELQRQMSEMQQSHQRARDEYERIVKQFKQENELLNEQIKQHLLDPPAAVVSSRKTSSSKSPAPDSSTAQPEIGLYKHLIAWRDAFTELTIYVEERLKNNQRSSESNDKVRLSRLLSELSARFSPGTDGPNCQSLPTARGELSRRPENTSIREQSKRLFVQERGTRDSFLLQTSPGGENTNDFAELYSMFIASCEKVLAFAIKR